MDENNLQAARYDALCGMMSATNLWSTNCAAIYLLSCDAELTKVASKFITCDGIDCGSINLAASGFDGPTRAIAEIACNIFSRGYDACPCKVMPYDISRLSLPLMEQVFNALHIAAENYSIVVSEDKKGGLRMDLDMSHYEKVKDSYKRLESLSEPTISDPKTELITAAKLADTCGRKVIGAV